jgi:hypothetical protein
LVPLLRSSDDPSREARPESVNVQLQWFDVARLISSSSKAGPLKLSPPAIPPFSRASPMSKRTKDDTFKIGDSVEVRWRGGKVCFPGRVVRIVDAGGITTYDIQYAG